MQFKDLSFWGIFKTWVVLEITIPILLSPFIATYYLIAPEKFTFTTKTSAHVAGITINSSEWFTVAILALLLSLIVMLVQTAILFFLAQKTALGKITIGNLFRE